MPLRSPLVPLALAVLLAAAPPARAQHEPHDPTVGVHGMLVLPVAGDTVVLSHLPLWRAPHDRQLLLVARLTGDTAAVRALRAAAADGTLLTLEPERWPMSRLREARPAAPVRLQGTLFRGHFERGGEPVGRDLTIEVREVLLDRALRAGAAGTAPAGEWDGYLVLARRAWLVHAIHAAPAYDQVVLLDPSCAAPGRAPRLQPMRVAAHADAAPLRPGERLRLLGDLRRDGRCALATVERVAYLEEDELRQ